MIKPCAFRRIKDCSFCLFASGHPTQPCLARVTAPEGDRCLDFRSLQSLGNHYPLSDRLPKHSIAKRLDWLNWHPLATGVCPECQQTIAKSSSPQLQTWLCVDCGWQIEGTGLNFQELP
ncbi:hypothetical protein [Synechococcus elongatus]|uniref:hypothetical protein n=1 Tax=Synechococcus elongatus TaxID=32046 RepID=UPI000F7F973B|nr:hypothetical protein [Synechococcus elongatus]